MHGSENNALAHTEAGTMQKVIQKVTFVSRTLDVYILASKYRKLCLTLQTAFLLTTDFKCKLFIVGCPKIAIAFHANEVCPNPPDL